MPTVSLTKEGYEVSSAFFNTPLPFISEESSASIEGDETKTEDTDTSKSSQVAERKSKKKKEDDEVVQIEVTAKLGGIAVTVTSVEGDLSHIIIGGNY